MIVKLINHVAGTEQVLAVDSEITLIPHPSDDDPKISQCVASGGIEHVHVCMDVKEAIRLARQLVRECSKLLEIGVLQ